MIYEGQVCRVIYSLERLTGRSVCAAPFDEWTAIIRPDGLPTRVMNPPAPLRGVLCNAAVVAIAASGCNPNPGVDIVRLDPADYPYIYNTDHYSVVEHLPNHPRYSAFCNQARMLKSKELRDALENFVFLVKNDPNEFPEHWAEDVPERIRAARQRAEA